MTSQWVDDVLIDTKQSCDKQSGSFTQDPGKSGSCTKIQVVGKHGYFISKTGSSHISQDNITRTSEWLITMWRSCELF